MSASGPRRLPGLAAIAASYDAIICDVWGVLHGGERAYPEAIEALTRFRAGGGRVALITNAPRLSRQVEAQLEHFGVPRTAYDTLVTSGDATRERLQEAGPLRVVHLGMDVHRRVFEGLDVTLVGDGDACDLVCCTALNDETSESPDDYRQRLQRWRDRGVPMVCANPDIAVMVAGRRTWCAGALAAIYREMGGEVEMIGKPSPPVYRRAVALLGAIGTDGPPQRVLAIGDGLATDIRGAMTMGYDALFVVDGLHRDDFGADDEPDPNLIAAAFEAADVQAVGYMNRLGWS